MALRTEGAVASLAEDVHLEDTTHNRKSDRKSARKSAPPALFINSKVAATDLKANHSGMS